MGMRVKRALFLVCFLLFACDGKKLFNPFTGGIDAGGQRPRDDDDDDDELPATHVECLTENYEFELKSLFTLALPPATEGLNEFALSPAGCLRLVRRVEAGQLRELSLRRWTGILGFDASVPLTDGIDFFEAEQVYFAWKRAADGALDLTIGGGPEDRFLAHLTETYAGDRIQKQELTRTNLSSGLLVERRTLTSNDANTVHFKRERLRDGVLTTVADFDAPALQRQPATGCYMPAPAGPSDVVACSDEFKQKVRSRLKTAIERGVACFDKYEEGASYEQFRLFLFYENYASDLEVECFQSDKYVGEMDVGRRGPRLRVNVQMFDCESVDSADSTLFHEVLHQLRGPHDKHDNELSSDRGPFGPRANAYTDSIRGCEALCFGTIKTACSCAACFDTDTCDSRCANLGSCVTRDPMGQAQMSEAVGALCMDPAEVPADKKKSTWHTTLTDCESHCTFGAGQCKSYSVSCDDDCQ